MRVSVGLGVAVCAGVVVTSALGLSLRVSASSAQAPAADTTARIVKAAQAFTATLDAAGKARVQFPFDTPQRSKWSNLPTGIFERGGVRMGDLTDAQRTAAMSLLSTAFSQEGYRKVMDIVQGDAMLPPPRNAGPGGVRFGREEYYLAFVGTPSVTTPWILQFGGHHLAVNMTVAGARATLAPTHTGAQPASYTIEGRTVRPLGDENDLAFKLLTSLDEAQQKRAILGFTLADLVLGPGQDGRTIQPEGLPASAMTPAQQTLLLDIVREWAGIASDTFAAARMAEIKAKLSDTWFAWSGPTTAGSAAYFRIQGPTVVIEYAPQRSVDHIHTIYRDPTNDYGAGFAQK